jgi:hypothetical protein
VFAKSIEDDIRQTETLRKKKQEKRKKKREADRNNVIFSYIKKKDHYCIITSNDRLINVRFY